MEKHKKESIIKFVSKPLTFTVGVIALYILTHTIWEDLFTILIVNPILSKIEKIIYSDLIVLSGVVVCIYFFIKHWRNKYIPSYQIVWILLTLSIIYGYYRFSNTEWDFTSFSMFESLKYFDLIFLITITYILLIIPFYKNILFPKLGLEKNNTGFIFDEPIGKSKALL